MTAPAVVAHPDTGFKELCDLLLARGISGVPIVDDVGRLAGIVTEADLVSKAAYDGALASPRRPLALVAGYFSGHDPQWLRKATGMTAADVMTRSVITARPADTIDVAARRMIEHGVNRLPVVFEDKVVGVVARHDLLVFFAPRDAEIRAAVEEILDDPLNEPGRYDVSFEVHDGVVSLTGSAYYESDARVLREMVSHVPGVLAVAGKVDFDHRDARVGPFV